jgi:hypothetical protein
MSEKEKLLRSIELLTEEQLTEVSKFIGRIENNPEIEDYPLCQIDEGIRLLDKYKKKVTRPIIEKKELMDYLDEKYGFID